MDEAYAVKQTQFLGTPVSYVCQNSNGPCPLLAIANVLLLRGQLALEGVVEAPGFVSARDLMQLVRRRLLDTNPPVINASELQRLTQEKTLQDVAELLPSMFVGLDVNVRFHNITDFEYTVACAAFDMLDIALVHGWLLDDQDDATMKVVGNKSYNELIERLVDYRGVLMTEEANEEAATETEKQVDTERSSDSTPTEEEEVKPAVASLPSPLATQMGGFQNLSIEINSAPASSSGVAGSPNSTTSMTSPKKSPSQQTVRTMMKERHISDADALDTATTLLEEGPVLEEFFNSTASQLTYYGLVKLHEELRERQLSVFFRNNHFSTLFKFEGALYLLVTDAGYLDEPSVVWELLNEIDGDTEYLDAQFRPVTSSEQQESILTQQRQQREQEQEEDQQLRKARAFSLTGCVSPEDADEQRTGGDSRAAEHTMQSDGLFGESAEANEENLDPDYLLALKFQREEEERVHRNKRVSPRTSPRQLQSTGADRDTTEQALDGYEGETEDDDADGDRMRNESSGQDEDHIHETSENEFIPVSADGEMLISEEELEAQRQAERYYQEQKRQVDTQTRQYQQEQEQERLRQQQFHQQQIRSGQGQRRRTSEGSDCTIS
ncbi:hypothetical protein PF011_g12683 [Phytophthora fragariae]|uniref:MINDY deubiquitinase domain-containing protein n=1 Tax=Phytophthora fragariae TaxID=53985 RepID=A0A6A3K8T0_9STRA|nr:hypothetical protein PF011_g12683 [Phytophthora fragariae]